jgi:hypothetical protein
MNFAYSQLISTYFLAYFALGLSRNLSRNLSNILIILKPNGQAAQAKQLKLNKQSLRIKYFSSHTKSTKHELNDIFIPDKYSI